MKEVKNNLKKEVKISQKLNLYLYIAEYIKNNSKLPISRSKQNLNYYTGPLKKHSIIFRKGYGVWGIDWNKFMLFYKEQVKITDGRKVKKYQGDTPFIRGHGFHFYIRARKYNWNIILKNKGHTKLQNGILRCVFKGNKVWFGTGFIKIYFPEDLSFLTNSANDSELEAVYYLKSILRHIERKLSIDLSFKGKHLINTDKAHYAKIGDVIAKECNKKEKQYRCVLDGKEWFVIDNSFNLNEAETTGKHSVSDMDDGVIPAFNSIKEYKDSTGEAPKFTDIANSQNVMSKNINQLVGLFERYAENMNSHVRAVQELTKGVHDLRGEVKKINTAHLNMDQKKLGDFT